MSDQSTTPDTLAPAMEGASQAAPASWQEQDVVLREMWMENKSPQLIADALNRSVSAIMTRAARLGLPRRTAPGRKPRQQLPEDMGTGSARTNTIREVRRLPVKAASSSPSTASNAHQTSPRVCLMCLTTFQSLGRHNRICASCKNSSEYMSASTLADIHIPAT
jgi:hypothetical protein